MFTRRTFLGASSGALAASLLTANNASADDVPAIPPDLDHIIVGFPNLEDGINRLFHCRDIAPPSEAPPEPRHAQRPFEFGQ